MNRTARTAVSITAVVETPLQLTNAAAYIASQGIFIGDVAFVLMLSGNTTWDTQTLRTAAALRIRKAVVVGHRGTNPQSHATPWMPNPGSWRFAEFGWWTGNRTGARIWGLLLAAHLLAKEAQSMHSYQELIMGNPLNVIPLYPLILGRRRRIVVVDDGLSMLEFAKLRADRRRQVPRWARVVGLGGPPGLAEPRITVYTLFSDLSFPDGVEVLENTSFSSWKNQIKVREGVAWLLGGPFVEEGGVDLESYRAVVSKVHQALARNGLATVYLPHRREHGEFTRKILLGLGLELAPDVIPVEERVIKEKAVASVVVAFGSTALETLGQMTGPTCRLWDVLLVPPRSKLGRDSPQEIFSRHSAGGRIGVALLEELDNHIFL